MFARVITAQAGAEGFDGTIRLAEQQLPGARQMPGFKGYYLLTDAETGKLVIISLWETREQMGAVAAGAGLRGRRGVRFVHGGGRRRVRCGTGDSHGGGRGRGGGRSQGNALELLHGSLLQARTLTPLT
jgi:heme-degrading monooxygenase HmoA